MIYNDLYPLLFELYAWYSGIKKAIHYIISDKLRKLMS